jgi:hypothetical protein
MQNAYWPPKAPAETTLYAFQIAFESLGYQVCDKSEPEVGYDKVAIFARNGEVTHAAISIAGGIYKSKLGDKEDIEHDLKGLEGDKYGKVWMHLRRKVEVT